MHNRCVVCCKHYGSSTLADKSVLRDRKATKTSRKWNGSCDSGHDTGMNRR